MYIHLRRYNMPTITLSIPKETRNLMKKFPEMNWSGFIRTVISKKTEELSWKEKMMEKFKTEQKITDWTLESQKILRKGRGKELRKKGLL